MPITKQQQTLLYASVQAANLVAGGHHSYATYAEMLDIPTALCRAGMLVTVYGDSTVTNNNTYVLGSDLVTFSIPVGLEAGQGVQIVGNKISTTTADNKANRVPANRSAIVYYNGTGTVANLNADDAVVRALFDARLVRTDVVNITAAVAMPALGYYDVMLRVQNDRVNCNGFEVTTGVGTRQDCVGIVADGTGVVDGGSGGSIWTAYGSTTLWSPGTISANYRFLNIHMRVPGGGGVFCRSNMHAFHTGSIDVTATAGAQYGINVSNTSSYEMSNGTITCGGTGTVMYTYDTGIIRLTRCQTSLTTATARLGQLNHTSQLIVSSGTIDITNRPTGGLQVTSAAVKIVLTNVTVTGGAFIASAVAGSTITLNGATTFPAGFGATYFRSLGMIVIDNRIGAVNRGLGAVVSFDKNAQYGPITSGTFTTDITSAEMGARVDVILASTGTEPALDATVFKTTSSYTAGVDNIYSFKVLTTGKILYTIAVLPA